jgi:hypothetical protein
MPLAWPLQLVLLQEMQQLLGLEPLVWLRPSSLRQRLSSATWQQQLLASSDLLVVS